MYCYGASTKANEMQNDIAKFKTTSKFQDKNSNFAPAQTQSLDLALLLLLTAHLAHKTLQNYRPRSIVDALDLHGQTHDLEVALVGRCWGQVVFLVPGPWSGIVMY